MTINDANLASTLIDAASEAGRPQDPDILATADRIDELVAERSEILDCLPRWLVDKHTRGERVNLAAAVKDLASPH